MNKHIEELIESDPIYSKLPEVIDKGIKVARVTVKMMEVGLALDSKKITIWRKWLKEKFETTEAEVKKIGNLPDSSNLGSGDEKRLLVYGEVPPKLKKIDVIAELRKYEEPPHNYQYECVTCGRKITKKFHEWEEREDELFDVRCPGCKANRRIVRTKKERTSLKGKSKDTDAYHKLKDLEGLAKITPLYKLNNYYPPKSEAANSELGKGAVTRYVVAIDKRLDELRNIKKRRATHDTEQAGLQNTKDFLISYKEFGKYQKLTQSFWDFKTWEDGKVHAKLMVTGTATGRFSCVDPNLQQAPSKKVGKIFRACFRAPKGFKLLSVDFSNLEVQVGARFMTTKS